MNRRDFNTIQREIKAINPNIVVKDNEYKDARTTMHFYCNKHNFNFETKASTFIYKKSLGCYYCKTEAGRYGGQHLPYEEIKRITEEHGYILKDVFYKNKSSYVNFICPLHEDKGKQEIKFSDLRKSKCACHYCNGIERTTEDFKMIIAEKFDNIEVIGEYTGAKNRIKCKCIKHNHIWKPFAYNLLSGYGCPICGHEQTGLKERLSNDEKLHRMNILHPEIKVLKMGNTTNDKVKCLCKNCNNIWDATFSNLTNPCLLTGCPICNNSKGEKRIQQILDELSIFYIPQYTFDDCVDIKPLPFDFFLPDYNIAIEYDGEFHYEEKWSDSRFTAKERLEYIQGHDETKTLYCIKNNIKLIRIPYWDFDKIEKYINMEKLSA